MALSKKYKTTTTTTTMTTKFYTFYQNNSGGSFAYSEAAGIDEYVIVEATNCEDANERAEAIGLYFNGVDDGSDCDCCGDRWCAVNESDANSEPRIFHWPINSIPSPTGYPGFVHYIDGRIEKFK